MVYVFVAESRKVDVTDFIFSEIVLKYDVCDTPKLPDISKVYDGIVFPMATPLELVGM